MTPLRVAAVSHRLLPGAQHVACLEVEAARRLVFPRATMAALAMAAVLGLLAFCPGPLMADGAEPLARVLDEWGHLTSAQRDALYDELEEASRVLDAQSRVIRNVSRLIAPSVVHIEARVTRESSARSGYVQRVEEAGAGVIVAIDGSHYVLTNRHVVHGAPLNNVTISLSDGRATNPTKVWSDPQTDIAVLALDEPNLAAARLGDSDSLDVGDFVLAVGSPFGLTRSITMGIVSAKGRRNLELGSSEVRLQDFIQTDAAINPGNSGGPMVNTRGQVVGIITAIASNSGGNEGVGFAIPINMFLSVARQFVRRGEVSRAFLGVTLDSSFDFTKAQQLGLPYAIGTRVTRVVDGSPAASGGLRSGDVILKIDGVLIDSDDHLVNFVNLCEIGQTLTLLIYRDGTTLEARVRVAGREGL